MSNNIVTLKRSQTLNKSTALYLCEWLGKVEKTLVGKSIPTQIMTAVDLIADLDLGPKPYTEITKVYFSDSTFKSLFDVVIHKIPTVVLIEVIGMLGDIWPNDQQVPRRLKLILIKMLEAEMTIRDINQAFFKNLSLKTYLLDGCQEFENWVLKDNVVNLF